MNDGSIALGKRVAVVRGMYRTTDGTDIEEGEVGWVVGFRGIHEAVVDFDDINGRRSACIPIRMLRVVAQRARS